jgi:hypothetical protein
VPSDSLSVTELCALILQHKVLADSYIESLIQPSFDTNSSLNSLTVVLHLPHQPGLFDIKFPFWIGVSGMYFRHYYDRATVSFAPHSPPIPTGENWQKRVDFDVKPTLLFLHRTLELFLQQVGPNKPTVSHFVSRFKPSLPLESTRTAICSVPLSWACCNKSLHRNGMIQNATMKLLGCASTLLMHSENRVEHRH